MASTVTGAAQSTSTYTLPSNIKTTAQAKTEEEQKALTSDGGAMGQPGAEERDGGKGG